MTKPQTTTDPAVLRERPWLAPDEASDLHAENARLRERLADWKQLAVANAAILEALHAAEGDGTALCDSMKAAILEACMRTRAALRAAKGE